MAVCAVDCVLADESDKAYIVETIEKEYLVLKQHS